ncbi:MAG: bifunctional 5,10-methylene-tetrahydrofolate dehydrogenase/5,10-methylene-tetrahydrofolate cyclohydrolase [Gemmatimonadetes bacterium]|nr:bifunctional 5,10-methylene-tetrahydrofolate dehydrogenase/5,10-methylene-tetrahydrofolate cyclohydrolase [Gemmatimonadota bacterium]
MPARIISGKDIAAEMRAELEPQVVELKQRGITPGLAVVLVGEDPASQVYVRMKAKACEKLGMHSETITLPEATTEDELLATVDRLNANPAIHGFLVQLPLPDHIDSERVLLRILPTKDVDGFHPENVGRVAVGDPTAFPPATPFGVQHLLMRSGVQIDGSHVVIVGRSNIVGRPMASLLLQRRKGGNATVTVCHSHTKNLPDVTRLGDILIVAIGKANFVTGDMIRPGAVVIDVGTNRVDDPASEKGYRLVGDVDFEAAQQVASAITPVPGGVGPMTITMLLYNTLQAARRWAEN